MPATIRRIFRQSLSGIKINKSGRPGGAAVLVLESRTREFFDALPSERRPVVRDDQRVSDSE